MDEENNFARGHPAIHVLPAALAFAEADGRSGRDLITAFVLGYEVAARIGAAARLRPTLHAHGTWGTTGAAVAVAWLAGGDGATIARTIEVAASLGLSTSRKLAEQGATGVGFLDRWHHPRGRHPDQPG